MPIHLPRIITLLLVIFSFGSLSVQAQSWEDGTRAPTRQEELPPSPSPFPCGSRDEDIFQEPSRTGHKVSQGLVDILDIIGYSLLCIWWLFAAGLLYWIIRLLKNSFVVWILMWFPFCLILMVAYSPLQEYQHIMHDMEVFQRECRPFQPRSAAFMTFQTRRFGDAFPYIGMLTLITLLYIPAIKQVVTSQKSKEFEPGNP